MKQSIFFFLLLLAISSCKKKHTCTCTEVYNGTTFTATTEAKSTTMGALGWCDGIQDATYTSNGSTSKEAWTCKLDQ